MKAAYDVPVTGEPFVGTKQNKDCIIIGVHLLLYGAFRFQD